MKGLSVQMSFVESKAPDKVHSFMSIMSISSPNPETILTSGQT